MWVAYTLLSTLLITASGNTSDEVAALQTGIHNQQPMGTESQQTTRPFKSYDWGGKMRKASKSKTGVDRNLGERATLNLTNFMDIQYSLEFSMGGQKLRGILDTGSFELLIMSTKCKSISCANNKRFYNSTTSETVEELGWYKQHSFGSGDCMSQFVHDQMIIGDLQVYNQAFWEVTQANMPILMEGSFEAVMGLGHPNEPLIETHQYLKEDEMLKEQYFKSGEKVPSWLKEQQTEDLAFQTTMENNPTMLRRMHANCFSFCFLQEKGTHGYFVMNDHDPRGVRSNKHFEHIEVTGKVTWSSDLTDVQVTGGADNADIKLDCKWGPCRGLVDTGTSLLTAPSSVIARIMQQLNKLNTDCSNVDSMPDLRFKLGGKDIVMPAAEYIGIVEGELKDLDTGVFFPHLAAKRKKAEPQCTLMMMAMDAATSDGASLWIMGMPWFRQYYTTFTLNAGFNETNLPRTMSISKNDGSCTHPSEAPAKSKPRTALKRVNLNSVLVPRWMRRAVKTGTITL